MHFILYSLFPNIKDFQVHLSISKALSSKYGSTKYSQLPPRQKLHIDHTTNGRLSMIKWINIEYEDRNAVLVQRGTGDLLVSYQYLSARVTNTIHAGQAPNVPEISYKLHGNRFCSREIGHHLVFKCRWIAWRIWGLIYNIIWLYTNSLRIDLCRELQVTLWTNIDLRVFNYSC